MDFKGNPPPFIVDRVKAILYKEFEGDLKQEKGHEEYKNMKIRDLQELIRQGVIYVSKNLRKRLEEYLGTFIILDKEVEELSKKLYDNQDFIEE